MSCLVWNCRGLGNPCTENELAELVRAKDPSIVFLAETWVDEARLKSVLKKIEFGNMFIAPRQNRGGGLVLFWRDSIDVTVEGCGRNYNDAIINKNKENKWRFTGFYGEPETQRRIESWNLLRSLEQKFQIPWLCAGDFNELTRSDEKIWGNRGSHNQMQLFRDVIDECGFIDLGYTGSKFTWRKHYANGQSIWERLDRALCTNEWLQPFCSTRVFRLNCCSSDHNPLWIVPNGMDPPPLSRPFKFEEMWLSDEGCGYIVEVMWHDQVQCDASHQVMRKVDKCRSELTLWSRRHFKNVRRELKEKKKLLEKAEQVAVHTSNNYRVRELKKEVTELMIKYNMMWRQRAKKFWLIGGDKNTKYFHSKAMQRHRQNRISGVLDSNGVWVTQQEQLADTFIGFYQELFTSSNLVMLEDALNSVPNLLTIQMNALLSQDFME